jgi:tartrate dehydrogenase/decarboxylase / D-malate dehydrogenase
MPTHDIAVIPGDGIGREVMPAALRTLEALGTRHDIAFSFTELDWGCERHVREGRLMPEDGLDQLLERDAILLGAVGDPRVPDHLSLWGLLIPIRRTFDQYVNLRPVRLFPGVRSPLADPQGLDVVIVRENVEGEYSEAGGRVYRGHASEMAVQEAIFTRRGVTRIAEYAFELAERRGGGLTSATKSNGIVHTLPFWDEIVREVAARHPGVDMREEHIDALCAKVVMQPGSFDVVVGSNLFGDILSDLTAGAAGSIGIAPSANLNPEREFPSMFEPVHGSAPDIAGQGIANPVGMLWSAQMMLEHLGHEEAAADLMAAIEASLADPATRHARPRRARGHRDRRRGSDHAMPAASIMIGTPTRRASTRVRACARADAGAARGADGHRRGGRARAGGRRWARRSAAGGPGPGPRDGGRARGARAAAGRARRRSTSRAVRRSRGPP